MSSSSDLAMTEFQLIQESRANLKVALAKQETRRMAQAAIRYINASVERYNRSAGQSRRQWKAKINKEKKHE